MNYRSHTLQSHAHILEIHLTQIPARDNSLILPRCGLPDLCSLQRSTDNLLVCSEAKWESLKCVFFLLLNPVRGAGREVRRQWVRRWVVSDLHEDDKHVGSHKGSWISAENWRQFIHMEKKFCGKWCVGQCSVGSLNVLPVPAWILSWYSDFLLQSKGHRCECGNTCLSLSRVYLTPPPMKAGEGSVPLLLFWVKTIQYNKKKYRNCGKV